MTNFIVKVNTLQREYLSSNLNHVSTIGITSIKQKYDFCFILDLASRRIVHYIVANHNYTGYEATYVLHEAFFLEKSVKPNKKVQFVHTDSGGIFLSEDWKECLKKNEIEPSSADSQRNQNQVSERFNRTLKKCYEIIEKMKSKR